MEECGFTDARNMVSQTRQAPQSPNHIALPLPNTNKPHLTPIHSHHYSHIKDTPVHTVTVRSRLHLPCVNLPPGLPCSPITCLQRSP